MSARGDTITLVVNNTAMMAPGDWACIDDEWLRVVCVLDDRHVIVERGPIT